MKKDKQVETSENSLITEDADDKNESLGFTLNWKKINNPSSEVRQILRNLKINQVEFYTRSAYPGKNLLRNKYKVHSMTVFGQANQVQSVLRKVLSTATDSLENFIKSEESNSTKIFEVLNCKYLINEFIYQTKMEFSSLYHPDIEYTIYFSKGEHAVLPYSYFIFLDNAKLQIELQHLIRFDFLNVLYSYLELLEDKLKVQIADDERHEFSENKIMENELLEVWIALKEKGFIKFCQGKDLKEEARLRDRFFSIFRLACKDYNDNNKRLKIKKEKGQFLLELARLMDRYK